MTSCKSNVRFSLSRLQLPTNISDFNDLVDEFLTVVDNPSDLPENVRINRVLTILVTYVYTNYVYGKFTEKKTVDIEELEVNYLSLLNMICKKNNVSENEKVNILSYYDVNGHDEDVLRNNSFMVCYDTINKHFTDEELRCYGI